MAGYLAEAELRSRGLEGLRDGLLVINHVVTDFWEAHFPQLDPDDDNDPTIRLNALARLTSTGGLIRQLRTTAIVRSRSAGVLTWTDCAIARGEIPTPEGMDDPPNQRKVDAIVESCDRDELGRWSEAVNESLELLRKIEEGFSSQVGAINSPEFDPSGKNSSLSPNSTEVGRSNLNQVLPNHPPKKMKQLLQSHRPAPLFRLAQLKR